MGSVIELGKEDRVRLLPDQKRMDFVGPLAKIRADTLGLTCALISLALGEFLGGRKKLVENIEAATGLIPSIPKRPVGGVPPEHLHVESSEPAIVNQAAFLRWV